MPAAQPHRQTVEVCRVYDGGRYKYDRWELLSLIVELRQHLGLNDRDVSVLRAHLSVLPHGPLDPKELNVSFMSVSEILTRACGMDERRFRRGEARLESAGLIARRLSGNGRRFPERDRTGRIIAAYGIDLAPLLNRISELQGMHEDIVARRLALRSLRNEISARFTAVIRAFSAVGAPLPRHIELMRERLRRTFRRKAPCPVELQELREEITSLEAGTYATEVPQTVQAKDGPAHPAENKPVADASQRQGMETAAHSEAPSDRNTADDGQSVRHIESEPKEDNTRGDLRKALTTVANAWSEASTIRKFYPEPPRNEHQLASILIDFSGFIGLRKTCVIPVLQLMGPAKMIVLLNYLGRNIAQIDRPEAYLRSLVKCYEKGQAIAGGLVRPAA